LRRRAPAGHTRGGGFSLNAFTDDEFGHRQRAAAART
jgi:hypothetical protein